MERVKLVDAEFRQVELPIVDLILGITMTLSEHFEARVGIGRLKRRFCLKNALFCR